MNKKQEDYLLYRLAQSLSLNNPLKYEEIHHMITSEYEDLSDDEMTDTRFEIFPQNVAKDGTLIIIQKGLKLYNISDVVDLLNTLHEENEQLKQRINSRLHFYRELYESTNDNVVKRVIEDLEDILKR